MKDHAKDHRFLLVLHFNVVEPVTRDQLSRKTTILWLMGWSFNIGSTVLKQQIIKDFLALINSGKHPPPKKTTRFNY